MCAEPEKPADKEICQAPDCEEDVLGKDCEDRVCLEWLNASILILLKSGFWCLQMLRKI